MRHPRRSDILLVPMLALLLGPSGLRAEGPAITAADSGDQVSFDKQIRPIFQAHCQGCHQPAKASGGYVMTAFDRLLHGGESDMPAVVPRQARGEQPHRPDHPPGRQGRDAAGEAAHPRRRRSS